MEGLRHRRDRAILQPHPILPLDRLMVRVRRLAPGRRRHLRPFGVEMARTLR